MLALQQKIQDKLSGEVLKARSGRLRSSIHPKVEQSAKQIRGTVEGAGGPAFYGQFHESGGKGPYVIKPVKKQALAFFPGGGPGNAKAIVRALVAGKAGASAKFAAAGGVVVKSVHHPKIEQRSFMVTALDEISAEMAADLETAAGLTLQ